MKIADVLHRLRRGLPLLLLAVLLLPASACAVNAPGGTPVGTEAPASAEDLAAAQAGEYLDVPADAWYAPAVRSLLERGIMNGTGDGCFSPQDNFTRAQLAAVLYRISGAPEVSGVDGFSDTAPEAWYAAAVRWAEQNGVVNGVGDGRFAPADPVTQEQLVTMLHRMEGEPAAVPADDASPYAAAAVGWARQAGIASDAGDFIFTAKERADRAQVAEMLYRYLNRSDAREQLVLTVAGRRLSVDWADNSTVEALRELLRQGELALDLDDFGGFEKGAPLPEALPQNNEPMNTDAGDVILYQGRQFVIYYDRNSWSLTPLGRITGLSKAELKALLGTGSVTAVLSLDRAEPASD